MYYIIITSKYNIGDVYWGDIENVIHEYMDENSTKFYGFPVVVRCKLNDEDISNTVDGHKGYAPLYLFSDSGWFYYRHCKSKKLRDYIFHRAVIKIIKLDSSSIISNLTITILSNYKTMTVKHKMHKPRKVLESTKLKHIKNVSFDDKINKYIFLALDYDLLRSFMTIW